MPTLKLFLPIAWLRSFLIRAALLLVAAGLTVELLQHLAPFPLDPDLLWIFSLSRERNLPTWYSAALLLVCSLLLCLITTERRARGDRFARHWLVLAAALGYVSLDEFVCLHENANGWFDTGGVLYFSWVIPASIVVTVLGVAYLRFLAALAPRARRRFLLAAGLYVGGALGVELGLGAWTDRHGSENLGYALIDLVEESLEIAGASVFLFALVALLGGDSGTLVVRLAEEEAEREPPSGSRSGELHHLASPSAPLPGHQTSLRRTDQTKPSYQK